MLVYFSENKCQYHKGQLVPFFIAIIVVLVVAALVTVNIGKTSLTKTETANAADAGALAGATAMANIYNSLAEAKESMQEAWAEFHDSMMTSFMSATGYLISIHGVPGELHGHLRDLREALGEHHQRQGGLNGALNQGYLAGSIMDSFALHAALCATLSCADCSGAVYLLAAGGSAGGSTAFSTAITNLKMARELVPNVYGIYQSMLIDGINPWHEAMQENYENLRKSVQEGYESAIDVSYRIAFSNSGIASRLADSGSGNNNKEVFSKWMSDESAPYTSGNYSWQDGQERAHSVNVEVTIDDIPTYIWIASALSYSALVALFTRALVLCDEMKGNITDAISEFFHAMYYSITAGILAGLAMLFCYLSELWPFLVGVAIGFGIAAFAAALATQLTITYAIEVYVKDALRNHQAIRDTQENIVNGLWPVRTVANPGSNDFLAWLDEVPHDHRVTVKSDQLHEGKRYSLWEVIYPRVKSSATAEFGGATSSLSYLDHNANLISVE